MTWFLIAAYFAILFSKWANSWKPRPPKHIREIIRRNRYTP
jgi:hypothetical protein